MCFLGHNSILSCVVSVENIVLIILKNILFEPQLVTMCSICHHEMYANTPVLTILMGPGLFVKK